MKPAKRFLRFLWTSRERNMRLCCSNGRTGAIILLFRASGSMRMQSFWQRRSFRGGESRYLEILFRPESCRRRWIIQERKIRSTRENTRTAGIHIPGRRHGCLAQSFMISHRAAWPCWMEAAGIMNRMRRGWSPCGIRSNTILFLVKLFPGIFPNGFRMW